MFRMLQVTRSSSLRRLYSSGQRFRDLRRSPYSLDLSSDTDFVASRWIRSNVSVSYFHNLSKV